LGSPGSDPIQLLPHGPWGGRSLVPNHGQPLRRESTPSALPGPSGQPSGQPSDSDGGTFKRRMLNKMKAGKRKLNLSVFGCIFCGSGRSKYSSRAGGGLPGRPGVRGDQPGSSPGCPDGLQVLGPKSWDEYPLFRTYNLVSRNIVDDEVTSHRRAAKFPGIL
jgi:hypothetical protein